MNDLNFGVWFQCGRLASRQIATRKLKKCMQVVVTHPNKEDKAGSVNDILVHDRLEPMIVNEALACYIVQVSGLGGFEMGDKICHPESPIRLVHI